MTDREKPSDFPEGHSEEDFSRKPDEESERKVAAVQRLKEFVIQDFVNRIMQQELPEQPDRPAGLNEGINDAKN